MTQAVRLSSLLALACVIAPVHAATPEDIRMAECAVWQRERSFARSVADHDAAAFAEHLHPDAPFGVSGKPPRARVAVTREWAGLIDGSVLILRWYPAVVTLGGDGRTAYSSGPALYEDPKSGATRLGRFGSVWQRGDDGVWRVLFDDGFPPQPGDPPAAQRFREGERAACPSA